jgi:hypothetical protein
LPPVIPSTVSVAHDARGLIAKAVVKRCYRLVKYLVDAKLLNHDETALQQCNVSFIGRLPLR